MTYIFVRSTAIALLVAAAMPTTLAAQTSDTPATKPVKEKKICRTTENTASRLGGARICHSRDEWAEIDKQDSQSTGVRVMRDTGPTGSTGR